MNTYDNSRAKTIARLFLCQKQHTVADLQAYKKYRMQLSKEAELKELRTFFKNDLEKFILYIAVRTRTRIRIGITCAPAIISAWI